MKTSRRNRFFAFLLLALTVLLSGCAPDPAVRTEGKTDLTALQYELENQAIDFANLWFYRELEEKTHVHVEFETVRDAEWKNRQQLMFASGQYKDLVLRGSLDTEEYGVNRHLLVPLDTYLKEYMPVYSARLAESDMAEVIPSSDGRCYYVGFLLSQDVSVNGHFFINRQWLDRLHLEVPTTVRELTDVLRAFRDGDPNGNGLKDEVPYEATLDDCNTGLYNLFSAWGIPMNEDFVFAGSDGIVRFAPFQDGFRETAEWMHLLCEEKLLDVESITQGSNLWSAKVNRNTAGFFSYWRLGNTALQAGIASQFVCMLPVHADGYDARLSRIKDTVEFGAALTIQNRDIPASLRWLDAQMDTETMLVSQNGPVGEMLQRGEDGRYQVIAVPEANRLYEIVPVICGQFFAPKEYYRSVYVPAPHRVEKSGYCEAYDASGVLEPVSEKVLTVESAKTSQESARLTQLKKRIKTVVDDFIVNAVVHGVTDQAFDAFIEDLKAEGALEYRELYQQIYNRHTGRTGEAEK